MTDCCHTDEKSKRIDWLFWGSLIPVILLYVYGVAFSENPLGMDWLKSLSHHVVEFANTMWWGVVVGIITLAILSKIPREFVMALLGTRKGKVQGVLRATLAGTLLDLCSHGILMVGAKLYERGATIGQVMAFLIASPWNSFSLTLVLIALIGLKWTLLFIVLSMIIAIITGIIFDTLVDKKALPANTNSISVSKDFKFWHEAKTSLSKVNWSPALFGNMLLSGLKESRMVVKWLLFGILLASTLRLFLDEAMFEQFFGPTALGLAATVAFATILEVCSEGSAPVATDILNRGGAPGNAFAFLMSGVSTDYTEIMVIKDTTKSWKLALFLPLITLPQIIFLGWIINVAG